MGCGSYRVQQLRGAAARGCSSHEVQQLWGAAATSCSSYEVQQLRCSMGTRVVEVPRLQAGAVEGRWQQAGQAPLPLCPPSHSYHRGVGAGLRVK